MLSLFPSLLTYSEVGPFIIRLILGITLAYFGYLKIVNKGASSGSNSVRYGIIEAFVAVFLIIGLYTQLAAMINALILVIKLIAKARDKALLSDGINYYILLLCMAISLIFMGAGWFAFDLAI